MKQGLGNLGFGGGGFKGNPGGDFGGGPGNFGGRWGWGSTGSTYTLTTASDTVSGTSGNDTISATASTFGADSINGGKGYDILKLTDAGTFNLNSLTSLTNVEEIRGSSTGNQVITLLDGADLKFVAGNGNDTITTGKTGHQSITLGTGANTVNAGGGTTFVTTSGGTDTITGGAGQLIVNARFGNTTVTAGSGGSRVEMGFGSITVTGGSGTDAINVGHGRGTATVNNFTQGTDVIDLRHQGIGSYADLTSEATITTSAGNTVIAFDFGPTITLVGIASVTESDFDFSAV